MVAEYSKLNQEELRYNLSTSKRNPSKDIHTMLSYVNSYNNMMLRLKTLQLNYILQQLISYIPQTMKSYYFLSVSPHRHGLVLLNAATSQFISKV